jgi:phospholipid/cholesterol/gamma-HCH transport system substrate-binding protein
LHIKPETTVGVFILFAIGAFFYMTFQIGVFRFDKAHYTPYIAHFKDISGLSKKADVKIAGVKVGWVDLIELGSDGGSVRAHIRVLKDYILHADGQAVVRQEGLLGAKYLEIIPGDPLTAQLGSGQALSFQGRRSGSMDDLMHHFQNIASHVEEVSSSLKNALVADGGSERIACMMQDFGQAAQKIASACNTLERVLTHNENNVTTLMGDMRDMLHDLKERIPTLVQDIVRVSDNMRTDFLPRVAHSAETIASSLQGTTGSFKDTADEIRYIAQSLKERLPHLADNIARITSQLQEDILPKIAHDVGHAARMFHTEFLPTIAQSTTNIADSIALSSHSFRGAADEIRGTVQDLRDRVVPVTQTLAQVGNRLNDDFLPNVARNFETTAYAFKQAAEQVSEGIVGARESIKHINEVTHKINDGQGLLGKIINEDEAYNDLRGSVRSLKNMFDKIERLGVVLDTHFESMYGLAEKFNFRDSKAYINFRIYPWEDYFYVAGLTASQRGFISRRVINYEYFDEKNRPILPSELRAEGQLNELVARTKITKEKRDALSLNLQIGKIFYNVAVRFGIFEGSAGISLDYRIPFKSDRFAWITSLEAFDLRGRNRLFTDHRPHFKWLNKVFFTPNIYLAFGADDFISKYNKNAFVGLGIAFGDDDFKYLLTRIPVVI